MLDWMLLIALVLMVVCSGLVLHRRHRRNRALGVGAAGTTAAKPSARGDPGTEIGNAFTGMGDGGF